MAFLNTFEYYLNKFGSFEVENYNSIELNYNKIKIKSTTMTKREPSHRASEVEDESNRKLRNIDSVPVKVEKNGDPAKSELTYFIKDERVL